MKKIIVLLIAVFIFPVISYADGFDYFYDTSENEQYKPIKRKKERIYKQMEWPRLRYNAFEDDFSYQYDDAYIRYNGFEDRYEWVTPRRR